MLSLFLAGAAPGGSRARFGLGLETFFEHQESLRITGMESAFTLRDLVRGEEESGILHGDPRLLNRKFDIVWEMEGAGIELPVILSHFEGSARSTLVLKAATADVTLDFLDRTQPQDSSSLGGRGNLFGAELSFASEPSPNRPWFTEASLGFQKIPRFSVERSPRFGPAGFEVPEDEVRLGRDVQELAARIGYSFSGGRVSAYTGVLHRWTNLEIEDDLRYRDPLGTTETRLRSQTDLESEVSLAVAGVDYRRGNRLRGRLEASVGEEDWGVVGRVVYLPEARQKKRFDFEAFATLVASQLAQLEAEFRERRRGLTRVPTDRGDLAYLTAEVERLLDWTEDRLFEILHPRELAPLRDSIRLRFLGFQKDLDLRSPAQGGQRQASGARPGIALAALRRVQAPGGRLPSEKAGSILDNAGNFLRQITGIAEERRFTIRLCVDSLPRGAKFRMWPPEDPRGEYPNKETVLKEEVVRGRYVYRIRRGLQRQPVIQCPDPEDPPAPDEPEEPCLDLLDKQEDQILKCDLELRKCAQVRDLLTSDRCPSP